MNRTLLSIGFLVLSLFYSLSFLPSVADDSLTPLKDKASGVHTTPAVNDPSFHKALLQAAAEYKNYGMVDENFNLAPTLCAAPSIVSKVPKLSASKDASTHGQKIYYLYAKNKTAYVKLNDPEIAQTIVKESWTPKKTKTANGESLQADQIYALFIMTKTEGEPEGTDRGWVYGTVSADGHTVTASGKVQSCMECHQQAPHGRLFGLKR